MEVKRIRYSEGFKKDIVSKIERGKLSAYSARKRYNIGGSHTIERWQKRYGLNSFEERCEYVRTLEEVDKMKLFDKEKKELEQALGQAHLRIKYLEEMLKMAEEDGIDIKKNIPTDLLKELKSSMDEDQV